MAEFIESSVFHQLVAILTLAGLAGFAAVKLKQPLITAFILAGLLAGPDALHLVSGEDEDFIETLAQFGIVLLLFMVGLKLDLRIIKQSGPVALAAGLVQVGLTFALGFAMALAMGFDHVTAAFTGLALSFSSTIIAVKLLSDKRSIDSLYGQLALGILIVQDLIVVLAVIFITAFLDPSAMESFSAAMLVPVIAKGFLLVAAAAFVIRFIAKSMTHMMARNAELTVVLCMALALLMAALCEYLNFSRELGGLIAGVVLASTPYNNIIAARLSPLRDFLLLFFFAHLGMQMSLDGIENQILPALALSAFVLAGKPLIITVIIAAMGFRKRTGFMAGLSLSQISEFSLILMAMGFESGLVGAEALNMITLTGLITMWLSTYAIIHSNSLYALLEKRLVLLKRKKTARHEQEERHEDGKTCDILIFGLGRYGDAMAGMFQKHGYTVMGVDFNPEAIEIAKRKNIPVVYGDAADPELPARLPLENIQVIVFAFHHYITGPLITDLRRTLAKSLREHGYRGHIAATSHHPEHDHDLAKHGIDTVLNPFEDAAFHGTELIVRLLAAEKA